MNAGSLGHDPATQTPPPALDDETRRACLSLIEDSGFAMVGSNGPDGHPWIKAMIKAEAEGLSTVWFSTNTSSARVAQFRRDPRASVYFVNTDRYQGLMLLGDIEVLTDRAARQRLWRAGNEIYYPQGIDDPDYSVFRFTARTGNYYHGLKNTSFTI